MRTLVTETPAGRALLRQALHSRESLPDSDRPVDPAIHGPDAVPGLQLHQPQRHRVGLTHTSVKVSSHFFIRLLIFTM